MRHLCSVLVILLSLNQINHEHTKITYLLIHRPVVLQAAVVDTSRPNGSVSRPTANPLIPGRVTGGGSPSPGNPFVVTAAPASTTSAAPDPFAKLATGLMNAAPPLQHPRKKPHKSDFFPEAPKPSLRHLSDQQQHQQQQQPQHGSDATEQTPQQTNVDVFGATPVSGDGPLVIMTYQLHKALHTKARENALKMC